MNCWPSPCAYVSRIRVKPRIASFSKVTVLFQPYQILGELGCRTFGSGGGGGASILRQPACSAIHACTLRRPTVMGHLAVALWHSSSIVSKDMRSAELDTVSCAVVCVEHGLDLICHL